MTTTARRLTADAALVALVIGAELAVSFGGYHCDDRFVSRRGTLGFFLLFAGGFALFARR